MTEHTASAQSPLKDPGWSYIDKPALDDYRAEDWIVLNRQRGPYMAEEQAGQALRMLTDAKDNGHLRLPHQQLSARPAVGDHGHARRP